MDDTFSYSLIRIIPDRRRGEWVNVGVVVYLADRLDIRLLDNLSKLRVIAPTFDTSFLKQLPATWERMCETLHTVQGRQELLSHMPLAHASPLAEFVADDGTYEDQIAAIMRDLVTPPSRPQREHRSRLETRLKRDFSRSKLLGHEAGDINRHLVVNRYPIDPAAQLYADFALRNGTMRLTETIDFRVKRENLHTRRGLAALKAITLAKADELFKGSCVPSVVYAASPETLDVIQPSLNLLGDYADRLYDADNPADMAAYMQMMQAAAHSAHG